MKHSLVFSSFGAEFTEWSCSCGANGSSVESCSDHLGKIDYESIQAEQRSHDEIQRAFSAVLESLGWIISTEIPPSAFPAEVLHQDMKYGRYAGEKKDFKTSSSIFAYRSLKKESIPHEQV